jgi:hypothetical protein
LVVAVVIALGGVAAVSAGNPGKETIARTAAGNARARAEVLRRSDFGKGWSGGFTKPDLSAKLPCSYQPKQSDLVLIGAAETSWDKKTAFEIDSEAQVLQTAAMVRRDWRRSVLAPQVLPCLREAFRKALTSKLPVTVRRIAFPRLTTYTRAYRFLAKLTAGGQTMTIESDFVALGAGRDEVSLTLTAVGRTSASLRAEALRLARVLAHRMRS